MVHASKPKKDEAYKYQYSNLERINDCIEQSRAKFSDDLFKKSKQTILLSVIPTAHIIGKRNVIADVTHECIIHDENNEIISSYVLEKDIYMSNMLMPEPTIPASASSSVLAEVMKQKGAWISYIRRYAMLQSLQFTNMEKDVELMDPRIEEKKTSTPSKNTINNNKNNNSYLDKAFGDL